MSLAMAREFFHALGIYLDSIKAGAGGGGITSDIQGLDPEYTSVKHLRGLTIPPDMKAMG